MKNLIYIIFAIISLLSFSCINDIPSDFDNPKSDWNPSFSLALGYTSLGMNNQSGFDTLLLLNNPLTGYPYWIDEFKVPLSYTMPFDLQELNKFSDEIISIMFRVNTYNGFPAEAQAQVYLLDINDNRVDSLFYPDKLKAEPGTIIGEGKNVRKKHVQTDIYYDQNNIDNLSEIRKILIEGSIQNDQLDTTLIDYYPDYVIDVQVGLQVELKMSF